MTKAEDLVDEIFNSTDGPICTRDSATGKWTCTLYYTPAGGKRSDKSKEILINGLDKVYAGNPDEALTEDGGMSFGYDFREGRCTVVQNVDKSGKKTLQLTCEAVRD